MEELLNDQIKQQVREVFAGLKNPVQILFFFKKNDCPYCGETQQLLEEVTSLSDLIDLTVYDLDDQAVIAEQYKITDAPGFTILAKVGENLVDFGIRYYGIPSGHEFTSLINDLMLVSARESGLSESTREYLKGLTKPVHLQVFITPT